MRIRTKLNLAKKMEENDQNLFFFFCFSFHDVLSFRPACERRPIYIVGIQRITKPDSLFSVLIEGIFWFICCLSVPKLAIKTDTNTI